MNSLSSSNNQSWLSWFLRGVLVLSVLFLVGRLIELQIIKGAYYNDLANSNRVRRVVINPARGNILARGGELLVGNTEVKKRVIFDVRDGYVKTLDIKDASPQDIIIEHERSYPLSNKSAHITGYVGVVTESEVGKVDPKCPEIGILGMNSLVGRSGLEEYYNCTLSGIEGAELIEVDTQGKRVRLLGRKEPTKGNDLRTYIDFQLQKKISELMADKVGAVIVSDDNNRIIALYSSPSYDPNLFVSGENNSELGDILNSSEKPLFNRAIGGLYHPGSVFKPLVAIAALEEGVIDQNYRFVDEGVITVDTPYGVYTYANWYFTQYGGREGEIDLPKALARSTDTFFYTIGEKLGPENMSQWADRFGMKSKTGIDLSGEIPGLVPDPKWKQVNKGERWFLGNTYHMSIGQGDTAVSPMHIHSYIASLANNGKYCPPTISGESQCRDLNLNSNSLEYVISGMEKACEPGGTGYTFFDSVPKVACKTGTAETLEENVTHAWFTLFVSDVNFSDRLVVTVLVEKGGEGSKVAGPIAKEIYDFYYSDSENHEL